MAMPPPDVLAANAVTVRGQDTSLGWNTSFNQIGPPGRWRATAPSWPEMVPDGLHRSHLVQLAAHEHPRLESQAVPGLLLADRPHARCPLRRPQLPEAVLSAERPVPWHVAEGRQGDRRATLLPRPRADTLEQASPEPTPPCSGRTSISSTYTAPSRTEAITIPTGRSSSRQPTQTCPIATRRARIIATYAPAKD
jgi:hypothetical protein